MNNIRIRKTPFLGSRREGAEDLFLLTNSFEPRTLFAIKSAVNAGFHAKKVIYIEYESNSLEHRRLKEIHRYEFEKYVVNLVDDRSTDVSVITTFKYDMFGFCEDMAPVLQEVSAEYVTIDMTTMTKCSLAALLSLLRRTYDPMNLRCVWTPGVYGRSMELTRGVRRTFVVPGFGGLGMKQCKVLVLFLGQESSRAHSLWRATDPDFLYLVASQSEYSRVSAEEVLQTLSHLRVFAESKTFIVDGVDPRESLRVLRSIRDELESKGYHGDVAVGCLGTKVQLLGAWLFFEEEREARRTWHYVYAVPSSFTGGKYSEGFVQELTEIEITKR